MRQTRTADVKKAGQDTAARYTLPFLAAYFLYYSAYALFSSYMVSYLTRRGMSATFCGALTSVTLLVSVLMQPVAGYLTDTFLTTRRYLGLSVGAIALLCVLNTLWAKSDLVCVLLIVATAAFAYPFAQLLDAWVACARQQDDRLIYSRVRAGGSIGFAVASVLAGHFFGRAGYGGYFLLQAGFFVAILPFFSYLPSLNLANRRAPNETTSPPLGFRGAFSSLLHRPRYTACLVLFSLYWMSHRPIGSYLALIAAEYGGGDALFGNVCGVGAASEFLTLLALALLSRKWSLRAQLGSAFLLCMIRPLLLMTGFLPLLYLGQAVQSCSFALFYSASAACFTRFADERIRSFSISVGLTWVNVVGTVTANFVGGLVYDLFGTAGNLWMSLVLSAAGLAGFFVLSPLLFGRRKEQPS